MKRTLVAVVLLLLAAAPAMASAKGPSVKAELNRLQKSGRLDTATATSYRTVYADARKTLKKLRGTRHTELAAVLANVDAAARDHLFTPSRLKPEMLTLQRNRAWWSTKPLPRYGQRTSFPGSQIVWQYYPGQGWQIQWLATFGKANALWSFKQKDDELREILDEARGLATDRAGGIAFEYLFKFDGGRPPWVSGLAQGTGLSAFSRGALRLKDTKYFSDARSALGIFRTRAPSGIRRRTAHGVHYLQYSFAPKLRIVNGFTQALNGLHDFAALANDAQGRALFASGERDLRAELPGFDTGAWSLYSKPGAESDLGYHKVLRDFLQGLCQRLTADGQRGKAAQVAAPEGDDAPAPPTPSTSTPPSDASPKLYCETAQRFTKDLTTKPVLKIIVPKRPLRAKKTTKIAFTLSKVSAVTITATRAGKVVLSSGGRTPYGRHTIAIKPSSAGPLVLRIAATDLTGNAGATQATVHVLPAPKAKKKHGKKSE